MTEIFFILSVVLHIYRADAFFIASAIAVDLFLQPQNLSCSSCTIYSYVSESYLRISSDISQSVYCILELRLLVQIQVVSFLQAFLWSLVLCK